MLKRYITLKLKFISGLPKFLVMLVFLSSALQSNAQNTSQLITLNLRNVSIQEFMKQIESRTNFTFIYRDILTDNKKDISIQVTDKPLVEVIKTVLDPKGLDASYNNNMIILTRKKKEEHSGSRLISGVVVDSQGEPVVGATIMDLDSKEGTITDMQGNFLLLLNRGGSFQISCVGFRSEIIRASNQTAFRIVLTENIANLEEIVVIGYGSLKRGSITSSISSLKREDFMQGDINSPISLVKGKVAGLLVNTTSGDPTKDNGGIQIMLRGVSNLSGNQQPLIVVDGIPGASLAAIAPDDVESIDILKDGSAAAIYGTRGNNGVIIITTKRGTSDNKRGIHVDYHGYASYESMSNRIRMFSAQEFLRLPETTEGKALNAVTDLQHNTNWFNEIYQTPINQNHNISIRSGDARSNLIFSANYQLQDGILKKSAKDQLRMRLSTNQNIWEGRLRFHGSAVGTIVNSFYVNPAIYYNTLLVNPTAPIRDATTGNYTFFQDADNPVQEQMEKNTDTKWNRFSLNGKVTFEPISNLNFSAVGSVERFQHIEGTFASYDYFNGDMRHGEAWRDSKFDDLKTFELLGDYSFTWGRHHKTNVLLGYSYQEHNWEGFNLYNYDFPTELLSYNKPGLGLAMKDGNGSMDGYKAMSKLISGFTRINYAYDDKYMLSMSLRKEGSTKFGTRNKWGYFPAISLGWDMSKENFLKEARWVDNLKIRAGYGVTGAEPNNPYLSINRYSYSSPVLSEGYWIWSVGPSINNNPALRWETKKETNIGIDYSFFSGRISGSIDLYNRRTDDLIYTYQVPVPPNLVSDIYANVGSITNKGFEIALAFTPVRTKDFVWNVAANLSKNQNVLTKLSNEMYQRDFLEVGSTGAPIQKSTHIVIEGQPIGNFYGWKSASISPDGSRWLDINAEPITMENNRREILGNGVPTTFFGISSSLKYKNLDASFSLRGVGDFQILNQYRMLHETFMEGGNQNYPRTILNKPYGVDTYVYTAPSYVSYYVENGDYLKIDNVTVGYTFRFNRYVDKLRFYISGINLYTLTRYQGIDPEINILGLAPGIDRIGNIYPATRSVAFGVQVSLF